MHDVELKLHVLREIRFKNIVGNSNMYWNICVCITHDYE